MYNDNFDEFQDDLLNEAYCNEVEGDFQDDMIAAYDKYLDARNDLAKYRTVYHILMHERAKINLLQLDPHFSLK